MGTANQNQQFTPTRTSFHAITPSLSPIHSHSLTHSHRFATQTLPSRWPYRSAESVPRTSDIKHVHDTLHEGNILAREPRRIVMRTRPRLRKYTNATPTGCASAGTTWGTRAVSRGAMPYLWTQHLSVFTLRGQPHPIVPVTA